jgi:hypothetical protein
MSFQKDKKSEGPKVSALRSDSDKRANKFTEGTKPKAAKPPKASKKSKKDNPR